MTSASACAGYSRTNARNFHDGFLDRDGRVELCTSRYRLLYELVGTTRESVSLVLGRLSSEGLAERAGRTLLIAPTARLFKRLKGGSTGTLLVHTLADANPRTTMRRVGLYSRPTPTRPDVARRRLYTLP